MKEDGSFAVGLTGKKSRVLPEMEGRKGPRLFLVEGACEKPGESSLA